MGYFDTLDPDDLQPGNVGFYAEDDRPYTVQEVRRNAVVLLTPEGTEQQTISKTEAQDQNWLWYLS